jgi:hypothetical protein
MLPRLPPTCETVKGTATSGESPGNRVLVSSISLATAASSASGLDAMYPPFEKPATPVYLSTAPIGMTIFGECDGEFHAFASADDALQSIRPMPAGTPAP